MPRRKIPGNNTPETAAAYLAEFSRPASNGCREWTRSTRRGGYGAAWYQGHIIGAHTLAYIIAKGPLEEGQIVRHTCDNPPCVNPDHLVAGTKRDNTLDMLARRRHTGKNKTHCPSGHPYDEANTYVNPKGERFCRICGRAATARYRLRKKNL